MGLERFIDCFYGKRSQNQVFKNVPLKDLRFVIDGNQISYIFMDWYKNGAYAGDYDEIYEYSRNFFTKFRPYIEIVIFNGSKQSEQKALDRISKRIACLANFDNKEDYLDEIRVYPPLFTKNVIIQVLLDLKINYAFASENANHALACYANGLGIVKQNFTILARNSYFNVYNLKNGYVCWKYVSDSFKNAQNLHDSTFIPVFYVQNLLDYLELNFKSWIYFSILLGNVDLGLEKNVQYFKSKRIDTRKHNLFPLVKHFKSNEDYFNRTNFHEIRRSYNSEDSIKTLDKLIECLEFRNFDFKFLAGFGNKLDDLDRFLNDLISMQKVYFNCLIEDLSEKSVFYSPQIQEIFYEIYSFLPEKYPDIFDRYLLITEYYRVKKSD